MKNIVNLTITHRILGKGIVKTFDEQNGTLDVEFNSGMVCLKIPESFSNDYVTFDDYQVQSIIDAFKNINSKPTEKASTVDPLPEKKIQKSHTIVRRKVLKQGNVKQPKQNCKKVSPIVSRLKKSDVVINPYDWDEQLTRSCDTCFLYKRGDCNGVRSAKDCTEYQPVPNITKAERYLWPRQGTVSSQRKK